LRPTTQDIKQAIDQAEEILVITHVDPDGDALGSLTAVGLALKQLNKRVTITCDNKIPERFRYLAMSDDVLQAPYPDVAYDLIIAVDCGDEQRMGNTYLQIKSPRPFLINIDHHITNSEFGDINWVNPRATSTTEILFTLFRDLEYELTPEIALSLLTGLVTDTLGFRTVGVTPTTMKIASALMDAGADLSLVTMQALNLKPLSTLKLWKAGLNNLRMEGGLIWTSITNEEREESGYTNASTGGLVNLMADVNKAAMSAVLLEMEDGSIRVGFRCRPPYSVSELALNLGGGGHPLASGCTVEGPLDKAEQLVVQMSKDSIRQQKAMLDNGHS
jgi:bifunctional oligoribonuclease and PAP phosphatase NrnA